MNIFPTKILLAVDGSADSALAARTVILGRGTTVLVVDAAGPVATPPARG